MSKGYDLVAKELIGNTVTLRKKDDWIGDKIVPYYCTACGFVELYKEMKEKKE
jgi:hypothetical protein